VCVFCGSSTGNRPEYVEAARRLGLEIARRGLTLVYGAGDIGLMGVLADAVLEAGGKVVGVIPHSLMERELGHEGLTELHVVSTMHERKALMADRSDAFIALPGGYGTLDELFEIVTWAQLGIHSKPVGLADVSGYFSPLLAWVDRAVADGLIREQHRGLLLVDADVVRLLDRVLTAPPSDAGSKWVVPVP
jgi:uncharacterized protein (TIGR00730 family)